MGETSQAPSLVLRRLASQDRLPADGATSGSSRYILSDGSLDRMGDVVDAAGWDLREFARHPIALFAHRSDMPVGTWKNIGMVDGKLTGELDLMPADTSPATRVVHALIAHDAVAISVGFRPLASEPLNPEKPWSGSRFTKAELVEASVVAVPANPNALAIGKSLGLDHLLTEESAMTGTAVAALVEPPALRSVPAPATHHRPVVEYSISKLLRGLAGEQVDWGFEREVSQELATRSEKKRPGIHLPIVALARAAGLIAKATPASTVPYPAAAPGTATAGAFSNMAMTELMDPVLVGAAVEKLLVAAAAGVRVVTSFERQVQVPVITGKPAATIVALDQPIPLSDVPVKSSTISPVTVGTRVEFERSSMYAHDADAIVSRLILAAIREKVDANVFSKTAAGGAAQNGLIDIATAATVTDVTDLATALALGREADAAAGGGRVNSAAFIMDERGVIKLSTVAAWSGSQQSAMDGLRASGRKIVEVISLPDVSAGKAYILAGDFSTFLLVLFGPAMVVEANYWDGPLWARGAHELRAIMDFGLGAVHAPAILKSAVATTLASIPFGVEPVEAETATRSRSRS